MTTIHAAVREFLQQRSIIALPGDQTDPDTCIKAGVVPFRRAAGAYYYYVMKPVARRPELGAPPFQLCKGTRQYFADDWRDMKGGELGEIERLSETALREAVEELGLTIESIEKLYDCGVYGFSSATTGEDKRMWLFAAELKEDAQFFGDDAVAETTAERKWLTAAQFKACGRQDHVGILEDIERKLDF